MEMITLSAVTDAARSRLAAVTAEVAAHVVLLAAEQLEARPCHITPGSVLLTDAGDVRVLPLAIASSDEVELQLRQLLSDLMGLSLSAPPALRAAAERGPGGGLDVLQAELHAALIPINHAAARRALARLYRETHRATAAGTTPRNPPVTNTITPAPEQRVTAAPSAGLVAPPEAVVATDLAGNFSIADPPGALEELVIDVDVVVDNPAQRALARPEHAHEPSGGVSMVRQDGPSVVPRLDVDAMHIDVEDIQEPLACRSDVTQLLAGFLAHTHCEARMAEDLRRMLGVDESQARCTYGDAGARALTTRH